MQSVLSGTRFTILPWSWPGNSCTFYTNFVFCRAGSSMLHCRNKGNPDYKQYMESCGLGPLDYKWGISSKLVGNCDQHLEWRWQNRQSLSHEQCKASQDTTDELLGRSLSLCAASGKSLLLISYQNKSISNLERKIYLTKTGRAETLNTVKYCLFSSKTSSRRSFKLYLPQFPHSHAKEVTISTLSPKS